MVIDIVEHVKSLDQIEQRTEEWYAVRKNMLTASDVAAAIGENPYQSRNQLLNRKTETTEAEFTGNFATIHGNKYEDEARLLFGKLYNLDTWEVGLFRHNEYKWLGGSPDGIASDGSLIEIKCPIKREIKHEIPKYYYPQVQICMEVLDIENCYFIQYKPENIYQDALLDVMKIPRSKEWFKEMYPKLKGFWDEVLELRKNPKETIKKTRRKKEEKHRESMFVYNEDDFVECDTQDI